ncbi:HvfC/BufC N-terminal domain-containing protein [Cupriavidus consociatus]|uniref:HvfC/BufC N-terminal domain-containing protein n=1 Tax=Cupriavidus consociatus TaxID=2821357 RepID=UPI001AEA6BBC|nr:MULTISPECIES: DNA-binding domain-containing protein [unclassified Cupriavidus]MBP0621006.1 putative DNA-binding domain-containing protein [Cupriavidus sp. LEh25]MDK2657675.1 DNA-binding domain-containing protein [Cupriavidus sp. LEh21]
MPSVLEIQGCFARAVLEQDMAALSGHVVGGAADVQRCLRIYASNMRHNLSEALRAVYPVIERLVGESFFDATAGRYIRACPSTSGDIQRFGKSFPDFLAQFEPAAGLRYLPDVARLEWLMHEVFHAADAGPLALDRLGALAEADAAVLHLMLNPACRLFASPFPVLHIWRANQPDSAVDIEIDADLGGDGLLVRRSGFVVEVQSLAIGEYAMLEALDRGTALEPAYQGALQAAPDFALADFIQRRILDATITDFDARAA